MPLAYYLRAATEDFWFLTPRLVRQADRIRAAGGEFYQFAFTRHGVQSFLEHVGFAVRSFHPYETRRACGERGSAGSPASLAPRRRNKTPRPGAGNPTARAAVRALLYSPVALRLLGHMILALGVTR